jgi:hypothetical protein
MLLILLAAQAATVPATPQAPAAKPKQVCQMMEVTGSRSKKRVCRDATGRLDLGPGVKDATGDVRTDGATVETTGGGSTPN